MLLLGTLVIELIGAQILKPKTHKNPTRPDSSSGLRADIVATRARSRSSFGEFQGLGRPYQFYARVQNKNL